MKTRNTPQIVGLVMVGLLAPPADAQDGRPGLRCLSYQGLVKEVVPPFEPLNGPHDLEFTIHASRFGADVLWSELHSGVPIVDGLFNVSLGRTVPLEPELFTADSLWIEITIDSVHTMQPRMAITAAPRAFVADYALSGAGGDDGDWVIEGTDLHAGVSGNVGIGTSEPAAKLTVRGNILILSEATGETLVEMGEGLDVAEGFRMLQPELVEPGTVVVIDLGQPGVLRRSEGEYDRRVAGIVAGARRLGSGVRLGVGQFDHDVALAGRVYCNVEATVHAVAPGDLLTTSAFPGFAMKAVDLDRAQGAILGKAMDRLDRGERGQILVLVTLQ